MCFLGGNTVAFVSYFMQKEKKVPDQETIDFRKLILKYLDSEPRSSGQIGALMSRSGVVFRGKKVDGYSVGINLRFLQEKGFVTLTKSKKFGKRLWTRNDLTDYYEEEIDVRLAFMLPNSIVQALEKMSSKLGVPMQTIVEDALREYLGV